MSTKRTPGGSWSEGFDWLSGSVNAIGIWIVATPFVAAALVAIGIVLMVVGRRRHG